MKKILLLLFCVVGSLAANAQSSSTQSLTQKERSFMNSLKSYLSKEGYRPEIDEDNDLAFKKEGDTYWITVAEEEEGYYFVRLASSMSCEDTNLDAVRKAVNKVNGEFKLAKAYITDSEQSILFVIDSYCYASGDFTKFFSRYMQMLSDVDDDLKDYYSEYDK